MKTRLDDELRERFQDSSDGERRLEHALEELEAHREEFARTGDEVARSNVGRWTQRASEYARFCGRLEESYALKERALEVWKQMGRSRAAFLVRLQTALVLAELGRPSEELFRELFEEMSGNDDLEPFYFDFWLEYDARRQLWEGDAAGAVETLHRAAAYRQEHRSERIAARTREAAETVAKGLSD